MAEQNIAFFCNLNFVKSAALFSDFQELSIRFKSVTDFYFQFLNKLEFLPFGARKSDYFGHYDFRNLTGYEQTVNQALTKINENKPFNDDVIPIHARYTDSDYLHLVVGLARAGINSKGYLHLVDLCLPKSQIMHVPSNVTYVKDILGSYNIGEKQTVKEFVESKGYNYNHFQRHCKACFGDSFYSFRMKLNIMEAIGDIIFTAWSLKEVAFRNKFLDYANMYKSFRSHGLNVKNVPRLANL